MKKIKCLLGLACMAVTASVLPSNVSAATGTITLHTESAFYEVDNRPYLANLSADCTLVSQYNQGSTPSKSTKKTSYRSVYLTYTMSSPNNFKAIQAYMDYYVNGSYDGHVDKK